MNKEIRSEYYPWADHPSSIDSPCPVRQRVRDQLAVDIADYLASGGQITHCETGVTAAPQHEFNGYYRELLEKSNI